MNKLTYILILFVSFNLYAQSGIVEYNYSFHPENLKNRISELKDAPKMQVSSFMKMTEAYAKQHRYIIKFTPQESFFEVQAGVKPDDLLDPSAWRISQWTFGKGSFYQNALKRYTLNQKVSMKKLFLIKDTIINDWTITYEKRIIGGYKCYKATKKGIGKRFDLVAWFTPEISVPFAPGRFSGTPGLVLELSYGPHTLTMDKIWLKKKISIIKPNKGKLISQNKLSALQMEYRMKLMNKRRRR